MFLGVENSNSIMDSALSCRACLSNGQTRILHSLVDPEIRTMFEECTSLTVSLNEDLPLNICSLCYGRCEAWDAFKKRCLESDRNLRLAINYQNPGGEVSEEVELLQEESSIIREPTPKDVEHENPHSEECEEEIDSPPNDTECESPGAILIEELEFPIHAAEPTAEKSLKTEKFKCSICSAEYTKRHRLKDHMHRHQGRLYLCEVCNKTYPTPLALHRHSNIHSAKPVYCEVCGAQFKSRRSLSVHLISHSLDQPHCCTDCGKRFKYLPNLQQHQKRHRGVRKFKCAECEKSFFTGSELTVHTKKVHTRILPHQCTLCSKAFVQRSLLKLHMRRHTGERNFACDQCDNKFSTRESLRKHSLVHTGEKPFECPTCHKTFRLKDTLRQHLKTHSQNE